DALSAPETLPDDPRIKTRVTTLRGQLDRAKALRDAGQYADGLAIATQVDAEASTISYGPLLAESALLLGTLRGLTGEAERAGADLDRSFTAALASGHMEVAMWASIHAVHAVGYVGHHEQEGRRWAHLATPLLTRLGMPARAQATLEANLGNVAVVQGELDEAEEHFHSAIDIIETSLGEHDVLMAKTLANLGAVSRRRGAYKRALASYERAGVLVRLNFGPRHPSNATISNSIGAVHHTMGDVETAEKHYRAVLALGGDSISATSPTLGYAHNNLGELIAERGQDELATGHFLAALRIWEESRGPDHPLLAHALVALGRAQINLGQPQAAVAHLLRAKKLRHGDEEGLRKVQVELDRLNSPTVPKTPE
ncbi:MAG: tetratricopeptide repeat protein, partial [Nannocystaceae bacterium]